MTETIRTGASAGGAGKPANPSGVSPKGLKGGQL
jgi:hypothetical protein